MPKKLFHKTVSILFLLIVLVTSLVFPKETVASTQFSTGYDIEFSFGDNGQATVSHSITLTNLTKDFFASEYSITTGSEKITNVSGNDGLGGLNISTKSSDGSTVLIAKLNQQVVGQGKSVAFKINYVVDGLAIKRGQVWEVNVPQIVTNENISSYKLALTIPKTYGALGKISPIADTVTDQGGTTAYVFTKVTTTPGVTATFGEFQLFKFTLKYRYKNKNIYPAVGQIALPPDTEYQAMYYQSLDPRPAKMYIDDSGNYMAQYSIKGNSSLEIVTTGYVKIFDSVNLVQKPKSWSETELKNFTKSDKYIDSQNQQIQKKAKELKNIEEIYNYVTTTLKYDYSRLQTNSLGRRGALTAINQPEKSICTDYSDLFVALARAKGIPARGLVGFAYTDNTDLRPTKIEGLVDTTVLHAWPEYYDREKGRWVQVDPTWGSTTNGVDYFNKLDTSHFTFAINGTSSEEPLPAGAYKTASNQTDDVKVEFATEKVDFGSKPTITYSKSKIVSGFPSIGDLVVENTTGRALFSGVLKISSNQTILGIIEPRTADLGILLPFEKRELDLKLRSDSLLDNKGANLNFELRGLEGQKEITVDKEQTIHVKPFFSLEAQQIALLFVLLIVVISFLYPYYYRWHNR